MYSDWIQNQNFCWDSLKLRLRIKNREQKTRKKSRSPKFENVYYGIKCHRKSGKLMTHINYSQLRLGLSPDISHLFTALSSEFYYHYILCSHCIVSTIKIPIIVIDRMSSSLTGYSQKSWKSSLFKFWYITWLNFFTKENTKQLLRPQTSLLESLEQFFGTSRYES